MKKFLALVSVGMMMCSNSWGNVTIRCKAQVADRCNNPSNIAVTADYDPNAKAISYQVIRELKGCFPMTVTFAGEGTQIGESDYTREFQLTDKTRQTRGLPPSAVNPGEQADISLSLDFSSNFGELVESGSTKIPMKCSFKF